MKTSFWVGMRRVIKSEKLHFGALNSYSEKFILEAQRSHLDENFILETQQFQIDEKFILETARSHSENNEKYILAVWSKSEKQYFQFGYEPDSTRHTEKMSRNPVVEGVNPSPK